MSDRESGENEADPGRPSIRRSVRNRAVVRDLILVVGWVGLVTFVFGFLRSPAWTYYLVVFGGIVAYSVVGDPWAPGE